MRKIAQTAGGFACTPRCVELLDASWRILTSSEGWIYFYNPSLKVVTDQDIRDDVIYSLVINSTPNHPLSESDPDDQTEVLLMQLHAESGAQSSSSFLVINHKHCIASYVYQEVKDKNVHSLDPNTCMILQELPHYCLIYVTVNRKRRLYWNYLWKHPAHVSTPRRAIQDASDALTWYYV